MLLFIPLALIATLAAMLLLMLIGFGFAFTSDNALFGVWSVAAFGIAVANAVCAIGGMNHPSRSALLRYLVLSLLALAGFWLVAPV